MNTTVVYYNSIFHHGSLCMDHDAVLHIRVPKPALLTPMPTETPTTSINKGIVYNDLRFTQFLIKIYTITKL